MADFEKDKHLLFNYINTAPYGFIIIKDNSCYLYQRPFETPAEEASSGAEEASGTAADASTEAPGN